MLFRIRTGHWLSLFIALSVGCASAELAPPPSASNHSTQLTHPAHRTDADGWIILTLSGSPRQIGLAHGTALAKEIDDAIRANKVSLLHDDSIQTDWAFVRASVKHLFLPDLDPDIRAELQGISDGVRSKGFDYDLADILAHNAVVEIVGYYQPTIAAADAPSRAPEACSAFVATGSATADGRIVLGHNFWWDYMCGQRFNVILDITPATGHRFVMDTMPGLVHSCTDFVINAAGIIITETTISGFKGFDPTGTPEFVRARNAAQYSESIDDFHRIMTTGNNGGYANAWLIADINTNEIAKLELGLKNVILTRTSDGAYFGSNFPEDPKLLAEECPGFLPAEDISCLPRRARWEALLTEHRARITADLAKSFMADTHDQLLNQDGASLSTICGIGHTDPREDFYPGGATNAKVTTAAMAASLSFHARMGFPDGSDFHAAPFLKEHPEYVWMKPLLRDIPTQPWRKIEPR